MPTAVTMQTIASQAGVTQATVSLALANHPRISVATRQRIRALAARLGYQPNPYVSALMRVRRLGLEHGDQPVIALVNGLESPAAWQTTRAETVRQMREGAIARARERGYGTEEFWLHEDGMSAERFSRMLHSRGIQGLLLGPMAEGERPPLITWELFAAVRLGVPLPALAITTVCNDHFFSSLQVMQKCHQLGYRRPGLMMLQSHSERFQGRWDGGLMVGKELYPGISPVRTLRLQSWDRLEAVAAWLRDARPDVIVTPGALPIKRHLQSLGLSIPRQIGLASLACPQPGDFFSGVYQNGRLIGATGIDLVIGMLERNERGLPNQSHTVMIEGIWNPGKTLRRPAAQVPSTAFVRPPAIRAAPSRTRGEKARPAVAPL